MRLPPTISIQDTDFHNAYARAVRGVIRNGMDITIGDMDNPKHIRDSCATFELTGNAIRQIENRETHSQYPFAGEAKIDAYVEEYHRDYITAWQEADSETRHVYIYGDRLISPIDQIHKLRNDLGAQIDTEISSNRDQAITWQVDNDAASTSPPCLQRVWIRHLGDHNVEVHLTWRSRDLYTAWQANMIALIDFLNREVIHPNNCRIVKVVDYADSLHIYHPLDDARKIKLVPTNPHTR